MPANKRDQLKRQWGHAMNNVERCQSHIAILWKQFDGVHKNYADLLDAILQNLEIVKEWLEDFARHAWGGVPEDYTSWRAGANDQEFMRQVLLGEDDDTDEEN